jgi:ribosomal protein S1
MSDRTENLYSLLEKSIKTKKYTRYKKGDLAEGVVEKVGDGYLIVKIDDVFDAVVPGGELIKDSTKPLNVGDKLKVFVLRAEDEFGNMIVSQRRTTAGQRWDMLEEAHKNDESVVVTVVEANNGGVIANIDGVVGFIPTSQLDPNKVYKAESGEGSSKDEMQKELSRRLAELIGTKITAKIMEIDKEKNKVIFSEKLALSDQPSELRSNTIKNAKIGDVMNATVTAVTTYGIFVNAEGLDGLVHVSEISWDKVENPADFAKVGDKVEVKLIDISEDGKRVAYSIKQLSEDPWNEVSLDYKVGGKVKGVITEIEDYGVIVKIDEGVTGLIHKSELSDQIIGDPKDVVTVGQEVEAVILTISPSERKMGLSIKRLNAKKSDAKGKAGMKKTKKPKVAGSLDIAGAFEKAGITALASEEADEDETEAEEAVVEEVAEETAAETTEAEAKPKKTRKAKKAE